jgi:hypothetical protein
MRWRRAARRSVGVPALTRWREAEALLEVSYGGESRTGRRDERAGKKRPDGGLGVSPHSPLKMGYGGWIWRL